VNLCLYTLSEHVFVPFEKRVSNGMHSENDKLFRCYVFPSRFVIIGIDIVILSIDGSDFVIFVNILFFPLLRLIDFEAM